MTQWTHNGQPVGRKPLPWRLAGGERARMEAALSALRRHSSDGTIMGAARALDRGVFDIVGERWRTYDLSPEWRRIARARLAIALRAALRADEDARCEEVRADGFARARRVRECGPVSPLKHYDRESFACGAEVATERAVTMAREWPRRTSGRALWDR